MKYKNINQENTLDSSYALFLKEIGSYPLLDSDAEIELGRKIQQGIQAEKEKKNINENAENTSIEEYQRLERRIQEGNTAKEKLVHSNLRLVASLAKKYTGYGLDIMDIIQEGALGLTHAAEKFDPNSGYRFSTYATWWIRQSMARALSDQSRTIRIPVHISEDLRRLEHIRAEFYCEYSREPKEEEILRLTGYTKEKLRELTSIHQQVVSLDAGVGDEEDSTLGDFVPDSSMKNPEEYTMEQRIRFEINQLLDSLLTEKESMIVKKRYGLGGYKESTLQEIASSSDVQLTRERIRQIEQKALRKLSSSPDFRRLAEAYFE